VFDVTYYKKKRDLSSPVLICIGNDNPSSKRKKGKKKKGIGPTGS
jgi:hypothetical protein